MSKRSKPKRIQDYPVTMLKAALEMREEIDDTKDL